MIFHEFFHYIGLHPQSIDQKRILWKSIISQEKTHFLRFGFLTHLTDAYETAPGPSCGAEIKSPRVF